MQLFNFINSPIIVKEAETFFCLRLLGRKLMYRFQRKLELTPDHIQDYSNLYSQTFTYIVTDQGRHCLTSLVIQEPIFMRDVAINLFMLLSEKIYSLYYKFSVGCFILNGKRLIFL